MSAILSLLSFWALVHLARWLLVGRQAHRSSSALPLSIARIGQRDWWSQTEVSLKALHVHVSTTALNNTHDALATALDGPPRRAVRIKRALTRIYDMGSVFGAVGMCLAVGALAWTAVQLGLCLVLPTPHASMTHGNSPPMQETSPELKIMRRALLDEPVTSGPPTDLFLRPIIPGLTVPLSHAPILILALFTCQVIHEAGHFIAAALASTTLHSVGVALTVVIPSAFVSLSSRSLRAASPSTRLRIVAAGAWHNVVLYGLLLGAGWFKMGELTTKLIGYEDISKEGRIVTGTEENSGLGAYLPIGALLTHLDDTPLGLSTSESLEDVWSSYLTSPTRPAPKQGWCVSAAQFFTHPQSCCPPALHINHPPEVPVACFTPLFSSTPDAGRCLDPFPLLSPATMAERVATRRCTASAECRSTQSNDVDDALCVVPDESAALLRITFVPPGATDGRTLVWHGPRMEVWEQVEVGTIRPRHAWLPLGLPWFFGTFTEYLKLITLSLYLFNLLPLPFLDGASLLSALLTMATPFVPSLSRSKVEGIAETSANWADDVEARARPLTGRGWRRVSWRGQSEDTGASWQWPADAAPTNIGTEEEIPGRDRWRAGLERLIVGGTLGLVTLDIVLGCLVFWKSW